MKQNYCVYFGEKRKNSVIYILFFSFLYIAIIAMCVCCYELTNFFTFILYISLLLLPKATRSNLVCLIKSISSYHQFATLKSNYSEKEILSLLLMAICDRENMEGDGSDLREMEDENAAIMWR